jgi:hypothetical protein
LEPGSASTAALMNGQPKKPCRSNEASSASNSPTIRSARTGGVRGGLQLPRPGLVGVPQVRGDQVVLGSEVRIESGLGHPGFRDDLVHAHPAQPVPVEQAGGGLEDLLLGVGLADSGSHIRQTSPSD